MNLDTKKEIKDILINLSRKNVESEKISDSTLLIEDLGFDSVAFVSLVVAIEEKFNVVLSDDMLISSEINQFKDLLANVEKTISEAKNQNE